MSTSDKDYAELCRDDLESSLAAENQLPIQPLSSSPPATARLPFVRRHKDRIARWVAVGTLLLLGLAAHEALSLPSAE